MGALLLALLEGVGQRKREAVVIVWLSFCVRLILTSPPVCLNRSRALDFFLKKICKDQSTAGWPDRKTERKLCVVCVRVSWDLVHWS